MLLVEVGVAVHVCLIRPVDATEDRQVPPERKGRHPLRTNDCLIAENLTRLDEESRLSQLCVDARHSLGDARPIIWPTADPGAVLSCAHHEPARRSRTWTCRAPAFCRRNEDHRDTDRTGRCFTSSKAP